MVVKWWAQNRCLCLYCRLCIFRFHSLSQKIRIWYSNSQKPIRWLWSMQPLYCRQLAAYIITVTYGMITSSPFLYIYTSRFLKQSKLYVSYPDPSVFQGVLSVGPILYQSTALGIKDPWWLRHIYSCSPITIGGGLEFWISGAAARAMEVGCGQVKIPHLFSHSFKTTIIWTHLDMQKKRKLIWKI